MKHINLNGKILDFQIGDSDLIFVKIKTMKDKNRSDREFKIKQSKNEAHHDV